MMTVILLLVAIVCIAVLEIIHTSTQNIDSVTSKRLWNVRFALLASIVACVLLFRAFCR